MNPVEFAFKHVDEYGPALLMPSLLSGPKTLCASRPVGHRPASHKSRSWWPREALCYYSKGALACRQSTCMTSAVDAATSLLVEERLPKTALDEEGGRSVEQDELQELAALLTREEEPPDTLTSVPGNSCQAQAAVDVQTDDMLSLLTSSEQHKPSESFQVAKGPDVATGHIAFGLSLRNFADIVCSDEEDEGIPLVSKRIMDKTIDIASPCSSVALVTCTPHPAWQYQQHLLLYAAVFLTAESKEVLCAMIPPVHAAVSADHMILAYKPTIPQLLSLPLGVEVQLTVLGMAADSRAQAVVADPPAWLPPTTTVSSHITISVAPGVQAKEAGFLMCDALQAAALAEGGGVEAQGVCVPGSYQHLQESLVLVGRVGVKLESGQRFFSLRELVEAGVLSCDPCHQQSYLDSHALKLAQVGLSLPDADWSFPSPFVAPSLTASTPPSTIKSCSSLSIPSAPPVTRTPPSSSFLPWLNPSVGPPVSSSMVTPASFNLAVGSSACWNSTPLSCSFSAAATATPGSAGLGMPLPFPLDIPVTAPALTTPSSASALWSPPSAEPTSVATPAMSAPVSPVLAAIAASAAMGTTTTVRSSTPSPILASNSAPSIMCTPNDMLLPPAAITFTTPPTPASCGGLGNGAEAVSANKEHQPRPLLPPCMGVVAVQSAPCPGVLGALLLGDRGVAASHSDLIPPKPSASLVAAASSCAESKVQHEALAVAGDGHDEVAGVMDDVSSECGGSSSTGSPDSSSSGGSDTMVMQKAAVHVGDYVLVAPFGSSSGDVGCVEGWVKDYVSDEAWQTNGVLVVLEDNNIGHVVGILDPPNLSAIGSPKVRHRRTHKKPHRPAPSSSDGTGDLLDQLEGQDLNELLGGTPRDGGEGENERVAELWGRFTVLQEKHGVAMCEAVLAAHGNDFSAAVVELEGQQQGVGADQQQQQQQESFGRGPVGSPGVDSSFMGMEMMEEDIAAARAAELKRGEILVLAEAYGVKPAAAVELYGMLDYVPAELAVSVLASKGGDVNAAAEVLLGGEPQPAAAAAPAGPLAFVTEDSSGSAAGKVGAAGHVRGLAALTGMDPQIKVAAERLREMYPHVTPDMAVMLVQQYNGNYEGAAMYLQEATAQAQLSQAEAASIAQTQLEQALAASKTTQDDVQLAIQASRATATAAAADAAPSWAVGLPSEEQQLAMLAANGQLQQDQEGQEAQSPGLPLAPQPPPQQQQQRRSFGSARPLPLMLQVEGFCEKPGSSGGISPGQHMGKGCQGLLDREAQRLAKMRESDDLRKQADYKFDMYKLMMKAYSQANEIGNAAKAHELKVKAAALKAEGENLVNSANIAAFESHNKSITNKWKVDLHGMGLQSAMERFDQQFKTLKAMNNPGGVLMEVITGKGKHSEGGVAKIKNTVLLYLSVADVPHGVDPKNEGVVWVALPGSAPTDTGDGCSAY